jgi:hypothetical protein
MRDFECDRDKSTARCGCGNLRRLIEVPVINVDVNDNRLSQHTVPPDMQHQKPHVKQHVCPLLSPLPSF